MLYSLRAGIGGALPGLIGRDGYDTREDLAFVPKRLDRKLRRTPALLFSTVPGCSPFSVPSDHPSRSWMRMRPTVAYLAAYFWRLNRLSTGIQQTGAL